MLDKEHKNIDAVSVSTPDNVHAVAAFAAMQLGKHVYVQKPLTHDIYEARMLTEAAKRYQVVTQMGNQGSSGDGVRQMQEWYKAGTIGDATALYIWTNRPVWPQGTGYPTTKDEVPKELGPADHSAEKASRRALNTAGSDGLWLAYASGRGEGVARRSGTSARPRRRQYSGRLGLTQAEF